MVLSNKPESEKHLNSGQNEWVVLNISRTYLRKGRMVIAQKMAETPPITSSLLGTGPDEGQIPLRTYSGEVPVCTVTGCLRITRRLVVP